MAKDASFDIVSEINLQEMDNAINQALVRSLLVKQGHRVVIASTGREVIEAYRSSDFDVVLMDISMPEMDGFEATTQLRKHQEPQAHVDSGEVRHGHRHG